MPTNRCEPCGACAENPLEWRLFVAGVQNRGCADCTILNREWLLRRVGRCLWAATILQVPDGFHSCCPRQFDAPPFQRSFILGYSPENGGWMVTVLSTGFVFDYLQYPLAMGRWRQSGAWNCLGRNTLTLINELHGLSCVWPQTVEVEAVV
jgi:hypothetical protein